MNKKNKFQKLFSSSFDIPEAYSEPRQTPETNRFVKIVNS